MEYKRFYEFFTDEKAVTFKTYLPVQLDACCNGFQHLALLSNKDTLFKELNLITRTNKRNNKVISDEIPGDLYNFLLYKLAKLLEKKLNDS